MNDQIFRDMAEQMKPSADLIQRLNQSLDQADQSAGQVNKAASNGQASSPTPLAVSVLVANPSVPRSRRGRTIPWVTAACLTLVIGVGAWAVVGNLNGTDSSDVAPQAMATEEPAAPEMVPENEPFTDQLDGDYSKVYEALSQVVQIRQPMDYWGYRDESEIAAQAAPMPDAQTYDPWVPMSGSGQYSKTNTQVAGIDEGDIVKTDGRAIYVASGAQVAVLIPDGAKTQKVASLDTAAENASLPGAVLDMMLFEDTLVVFIHEYEAEPNAIGGHQDTAYVPYKVSQTRALLYDVTVPAQPELITSLGQSGSYSTSRLTGSTLYLVTDYRLDDPTKIEQDQPVTFVPQTFDDTEATPLAPEDIRVVDPLQDPRYSVVSSVDLGTNQRLKTQSVLMGAETVYMGHDNLYLAVTNWGLETAEEQLEFDGFDSSIEQNAVTQIVRLALNDGAPSEAAKGTLPGHLLSQFSLDEYEGHLRVVLDVSGFDGSNWVQQASLYTLDADLLPVGSIPSLAKFESVKSVRFDGPVGYVVTFEQTDPLFAVDLSDPTNPTVMSALETPGFSTYLHPWSPGNLLGFGVDGDSDGWQQGLKLAMFDTSDPYQVTELAKLHIMADYSEALDEHKAVLVSVDLGLIGLPTTTYGANDAELSFDLYRFDSEEGFSLLKSLPLVLDQATGTMTECAYNGFAASCLMNSFIRGVLIDDCLYVVTAQQVEVYDLDSLTQLTSVTFD
ncbi:MAG: beta-propeller domain-containing protein [Micrococcales bacterium]|nr:beta-propeller domain-containing protein [Micrococcales bacterium]